MTSAAHTRESRLRSASAATALILWALLILQAGAAQAQDLKAVFSARVPGSTRVVDHGAWDALLRTYTVRDRDGATRVAYADLKAEALPRLEAYIAALEALDPRVLDGPEQIAYWANLYNAKTVAVTASAYPVASIKDINLGGGLLAAFTGGPWKAKVLKVAGLDLSLDDIEHGILRPVFKDPRIHYALNCASLGCPNLSRKAFRGASLAADLDAAAVAFVNDPRGVRLEGGRLIVSSIYVWFGEDFGGASGVISHLRAFAAPALVAKLRGVAEIADHSYDWRLNDVRS